MSLRKEQVLLLVTLVVGALVFNSLRSDEWNPARVKPKVRTLAAAALPPTPLAAARDVAVPPRDWGREPSETQPLPPRALEFPARPPLRLIALPLPLGPDWTFAQLLLISGEVVADVQLGGATQGGGTLGGATEAGTEAGSAAPGAGPSTPSAPASGNPASEAGAQEPTAADKTARFERMYDRVWNTANSKVPLYGIVDYPGGDPFDLEEPNFDFTDKKIRLRQFSTKTEKMLAVTTLEGKDIQRIRLRENLRNEVEREKRKVPKDINGLPERAKLIRWLLDKGREDASVYDDALEQANVYFKLSQGLDGLKLKALVLRARGDLGSEFQLYQTLPPEFQDSAFRYQGLGELEQRLGLDAKAEEDLRHAVEKAPTQPLPRAALAEFLLRHGQAPRAVVEAERALQGVDMVHDDDLRRLAEVVVGCQLAVGKIDAARATLNRTAEPSPYLLGCVEYAAGQIETALTAFRQASGSADTMPALLGVGACQLRLAQWQSAKTAFDAVADLAPLLRHRALCGLALLSMRIDKRGEASGYLDRALEAAPGDLYALYLRMRLLRDGGELQPAMEASTEVLQKRDDFVYAVAERAALHVQLARATNDLEQAENVLAARNYADRAVALSPAPQLELIELQARLHFFAGDVRGAEEAFELERQTASSDDDKLFARAGQILCDYQRNRVADALEQLDHMIQDLPKENPIRQWAEARKLDIDDHSQKEQLDDRFDRAEPGAVWEPQGSWRPTIVENHLQFQNRMAKPEEVAVDRAGAVKKGKQFLAVEVVMTVGKAQSSRDASAGLKIETAGRAGAMFQAWIGVKDGAPFLRIKDGKDEPFQLNIAVPDFDAQKPQRLRLEVVPRSEQKQFVLQCYWNGALVHQQDKVTSLNANTADPLRTLLFAAGSKDTSIDVSFDDYHLERRKDGLP